MNAATLGVRAAARVCVAVLCLLAGATAARANVPFTQSWSPHNRERPVRQSTLYIILHTTEGPAPGSLQKLRDNGEANFFVDPTGRIYAIIDRRRVALHAGRSMWRGRTNMDEVSIGIEVAGYYYQNLTAPQYTSLRALLTELQAQYGIADANVLTHSMVAYGAPNRWHRRSHRGRKRCGMLFASSAVRQKLGLTDQPSYDPDVRAGRLVVGDPYLAQKLYSGSSSKAIASASVMPAASSSRSRAKPAPVVPAAVATAMPPPGEGMLITANRSAWDVARDMYNEPTTRYVFPDGKVANGNQIRNWKSIPPGTRVIIAASESENSEERLQRIGRDGDTAREVAGDEFNTARTIYFLKDGRIRTGAELAAAELDALPAETGMLVGYAQGGAITAKRRAFDVCGVKWNNPSTFYRFPDGSIQSGAQVRENAIPLGTQVFFRN
ncbi:MAG: N-acetylmuramoyl-L-alanine amidase [Lentisphaerae bacterium]|nr:N-acetylmuramoyl-L-alanine amidase [Lentisphaerota bacterium]